jgi:hypothetical protein
MTTTVEATFDGQVFRPTTPVSLEPNTPVRLTVEPLPPPGDERPASFLRTAKSLNLVGAPDWSANLDH